MTKATRARYTLEFKLESHLLDGAQHDSPSRRSSTEVRDNVPAQGPTIAGGIGRRSRPRQR